MSQQNQPTSANGSIPHPRSKPQPSQSSKLISKPSPPFDIDNHLNPFIPRNPFRYLPSSLSYWFGYRSPSNTTHAHPFFTLFNVHPNLPKWYFTTHMHTLFLYISILTGAFVGVAIIENVFLALPQLSGHAVPIVIASFGAAAILEYNTIESPLAQPRNLIFGHFLSAVVGVGITKLFLLLSPSQFEGLRWLAGALAVGVASVLMSFTKTVHPPAGATALLAATNLEIQELGWWLLPLVLLASILMLASALVVNNGFGRRYPVYWWTPVDLVGLRENRRKERAKKMAVVDGDVEKGDAGGLSDASTEMDEVDLRKQLSHEQEGRVSRAVTYSSTDRVPHAVTSEAAQASEARKEQKIGEEVVEGESILLTKHKMVVPEWLELSDWEDEVLRILMERMRERQGQAQ